MEQYNASKNTVVLLPMPLQGHMTPMLQLGSILHSKGFSIVVAHSEFRPPNPLNHPEFAFHCLSDDSSGYRASIMYLKDLILALNSNCRAPLQQFLVQLIEDQKLQGRQVACIIYDFVMFSVDSVATELKIPGIVLRTTMAFYILAYRCIFQLQTQNLIPFPESRLQELVPKLYPLRFKDIPFPITTEISEELVEFWDSMVNERSSVAVICNSTDYLDHSSLSLLEKHYKAPFFLIGPFHKMAAAAVSSTSFLEEDQSCISWLEKRATNSVLFVSLGSIASIDLKELVETAWGLANSGIPFLWVIRRGPMNGEQELDRFIEGHFKASVGERGLIVNWAPQKKVLAHKAVGGFWSHCGWNSTLESICEGVPMICRPHFGDQVTNARYLTCVWKVGIEMENDVLDRKSIEKSIRRLMVDARGKEMRQRVLFMKEKIEASLLKGGSSYESLNDLTHFINSLSLAARK